MIVVLFISLKSSQGWGGVSPMQLKANFKVLKGMEAFLMSESDIDAHVDRLVMVRPVNDG